MTRAELTIVLKEKGILPTPQRLDIAEILLARPQHMPAEVIIERLREVGSEVSKATVYNTLNLFAEKRLVRELVVASERRFYDSRTETHHHFFNVDTGELRDIDDADVGFSRLPILPNGTRYDGVEVFIKVREKGE